jgi:hypothetical protein
VVRHKPALEDDLDELDDFQIPKRLKIVAVKMYVHFLKSAASSGNRGMQTQLEQNSLTLEQKMNQENEKLMNPEMKDQPWKQHEIKGRKKRKDQKYIPPADR